MSIVRIGTRFDDEEEPKMLPVYTTELAPEEASKRLEHLNVNYPLPSTLAHVKRIWRVQPCKKDKPILKIILGLTSEGLEDRDWQQLACTGQLGKISEITIAQVPSRTPRTREEYERWRARGYWPTVFHECKTALREEAEELAIIQELGQAVISRLLEDELNGVVIVDPNEEGEAGWVWGCSQTGPLDHPEMMAIERIAKQQLDLDAKIRANSIVSDSRIESGTSLESNHESTASTPPPMPYLCTGRILFSKREPCIMCAMAMVHSRIRAIVFIDPDPLRGGIYSRLRLQEIQKINHHFSVYRYIR